VSEGEHERGDEHQVTPLELFFDLTFVFAITQVTALLADDPTWGGVLRGMLVLAAVWWAWGVYSWLTSAMDVDEGGVRLAMLASMGAMFGVAWRCRAPSETTPCCVSRQVGRPDAQGSRPPAGGVTPASFRRGSR
jgi:Bacterial low temperature requirement A protein (LtrA)